MLITVLLLLFNWIQITSMNLLFEYNYILPLLYEKYINKYNTTIHH